MKPLLLAIQSELQNSLPGFRAVDIFITPHENYIPPGIEFPAVGIKDGTVKRHELAGNGLDRDLHVNLIPYVKLFPGEESIVGNVSFDGVLDVVQKLHSILDQNDLGLQGVDGVFCSDEKASEMFGDGNDGLQRKIITYKYEIRSDR